MESLKNKSVLIADDDIDILTQLSVQLKNLGLHVISAETQKEAEDLIESTKVDIAIFDLMMENRDSGFILGYKMKKKYPETPVIIITSVTADTRMFFDASMSGEKDWIKADRYLEKGWRPEQLETVIKELLK